MFSTPQEKAANTIQTSFRNFMQEREKHRELVKQDSEIQDFWAQRNREHGAAVRIQSLHRQQTAKRFAGARRMSHVINKYWEEKQKQVCAQIPFTLPH